ISSSMCSTRSMNERIRSPGIPAVSVMPAPHFKRSCSRATRVTEKLMEPPEFPLRGVLPLSLALTPMQSRGNHGYLVLRVQIATNALSEGPALVERHQRQDWAGYLPFSIARERRRSAQSGPRVENIAEIV